MHRSLSLNKIQNQYTYFPEEVLVLNLYVVEQDNRNPTISLLQFPNKSTPSEQFMNLHMLQ